MNSLPSQMLHRLLQYLAIMLKSNQLFKSDFIWLATSFVFTFVFAFVCFESDLFTGYLDVHVHDTYFVTPAYLILFILFLLFTFILFFFKSSKSRYRTSASFIITCFCGSLLILFITLLTLPTATVLVGGSLTLYPPLSSLGHDQISEMKSGFPFVVITGILITTAVLVFILTLSKAYRWGEYRTRKYPKE
jgi:hypothetical protein